MLILSGQVAISQQTEPCADRPRDQAETTKSAWLHEVYLQEASDYDFYLDAQKRQALKLRREPVMCWTSQGDFNGEVYVWTHQGRAEVVGCIFSAPGGQNGRRILHEFHSLAPQPIVTGTDRGGSGWQPQEAGVALEPIPEAPGPAGTEARRLTQMRDLARRYRAHVERENSNWELRLLPQPLYRYELTEKDSPIVDGAVFAYVWTAGTDPEVLLVIEARHTENGVSWYHAIARFTNRPAWVYDRDREVWRVDVLGAGNFDGTTSKRYGAFSVKTVPNPAAPR